MTIHVVAGIVLFNLEMLSVTVVNVGLRRTGEREGVRQSLGNISQRATQSDIAALSRRVFVKELDSAALL